MSKKFVTLVILIFCLPFGLVSAQGTVSLSVTPTLFEMSANPGQEWKSMVKVVNVNQFDLTVYVSVVNFAPKGEGGDGLFIPVFEQQTEGTTLAEWVDVSSEPIVIPRQQTIEVPFTVKVPEDASPGGHFAAILVGTKPPETKSGESRVKTSQMVSSLFFVRIAGDVIESGDIREFRTTSTFLTKPEATFELRFENKGNVHIQPQGDIRIFNMWGQERGVIPINRQSHFGNVLPDSIRKFSFSWSGEWNLTDIGRYSAMATLGYGTDERKFSSQKTYFWLVPVKQVSLLLLGIGVFIVLITWLVRLYVRRMLTLAGFDPDEKRTRRKPEKPRIIYENKTESVKQNGKSEVSVIAPLKVGILDLQSKLKNSNSNQSWFKRILSLLRDYWKFVAGIIAIVIFIVALVWYVKNATTDNRAFEVTYLNSESEITLSSEEIIYNDLVSQRDLPKTQVDDSLPSLIIVNRSGVSGQAAKARLMLEQHGYETVTMKTDSATIQDRTVVVYNELNQQEALELSTILNNAPISVYGTENSNEAVTIYIGRDINLE